MARRTEVILCVGGAAGDGVASAGETFAKLCARSGLHVIAYNSYQSVIRGGHAWLQVRAGEEKMHSQRGHFDILIALNLDTIEKDAQYVASGGSVLFNSDRVKVREDQVPSGVTLMPLPVGQLAGQFSKAPIIQNMVALGAAVRLADMEFALVEELVGSRFSKKGSEVAQANINAARAGYDHAGKTWGSLNFGLKFSGVRRLVLTGNQAIAVGATAGGLKFYAAYPMTPASSILHWFAARGQKYGVLVKQAEDEIAVLNMAIGAGYAGVRAMCGTSGGGFALMTEAVGEAAMTETPVVIVNAQRGGPSTGLPTKTEQGDLFQMLGASQGDFPKALIAPVSVEDAFYATAEALNLADKYQIPVMIASDLYLSEHMETVDPEHFDFSAITIDRGAIAGPHTNGNGYKRYEDTDTGVSPRAFPGTEGCEHVTATDEHDEDGTLISDVFTDEAKRIKMMNKRMRKLEFILKDMAPPKLDGPADAELTLVGWGSTRGVIIESIQIMAKEGVKINHLQLRNLWPFPVEAVTNILKSCRKTMVVENNYSGQLAKLIRMETGIAMDEKCLKYDGEPFYPGDIVARIKEVI